MKKKAKKVKKETLKQLTDKELEILKEVLAKYEVSAYKSTGIHSYRCGFATADMGDYDNDTIYIDLKWGQLGDADEDLDHIECTLERKELTSKKTVNKIVNCIQE